MFFVRCIGNHVPRHDALDNGADGRRCDVDRVPDRGEMETGRTAAALSGRMPVYHLSGACGRQRCELPAGDACVGLYVAAVPFQRADLSDVFRDLVCAVHTRGFPMCIFARRDQFAAKKSRIPFAIAEAIES